MCGIFSLFSGDSKKINKNLFWNINKFLFNQSSRRGKDSAGLYLHNGQSDHHFIENHYPKSLLNLETKKIIKNNFQLSSKSISIGQTRMITNGSDSQSNTQPLIIKNNILVHNGIITNEYDLRDKYKINHSADDVDTKLAIKIMINNLDNNKNFLNSFSNFQGANNFIFFERLNKRCTFYSSHGSLYYSNLGNGLIVLASEKRIISNLINKFFDKSFIINQCKSNLIYQFTFQNPSLKSFTIKATSSNIKKTIVIKNSKKHFLSKYASEVEKKINDIHRCSKCLLPNTVPFIKLNESNICNYCENFGTNTLLNKFDLNKLESHLLNKNKILFPLSGGRDSCYGLNFLSNYKHLNITAYTYDWGMVTDLARRNISRICGKLQIEHILISADIRKKLSYIKKNISSWLNRPNLGIVPLFMAGDKQFFYYMDKIKSEIMADEVISCFNPLERTDFKTGFCGVNPFKVKNKKLFLDLDFKSQFTQLKYYGKEFILNPSYINSSLFDTIWAYLSYYVFPKNFLTLFDYIPWREEEIENTIVNECGWELANDTSSSWRIGDGTAPFYNYLYMTIAGFTENDALRSNQIRLGHLTRDQAFIKLKEDNSHRLESLEWYFERIGLDPVDTLSLLKNKKIHLH